MTSRSHHGSYELGYTCYNGETRGDETARLSQILKKLSRSSDCSLQLENMKLESLVIADQHAAVNTFLVLYTPPVTPGVGLP